MNKKRITAIIMTCLMTALMCVPVLAAEPDSAGNVFDADNAVSLSSPVFGAFLAGQSVSVSGAEAQGSVFAAGQEVTVAGAKVGESLYVAGNSATVNDTEVGGNVWAAGNTVTIGTGVVANGVYAAGSMITFSGMSSGFFASGSTVTLAGIVDGDVTITADKVEVAQNAIVTGTLTVKSANEPDINDGAQINDYDYDRIDTDEAGEGAAKVGFFAMFLKQIGKCLYWIVAMAVFGLLLCWLFNDHLNNALTYIKERPAAMIGTGIVSWMCIPLAALLLCCSYLLAPISGMLMLAYVLLLCAGLAFTGASLARLVFPKMNVFLSAAIGIAALEIVRMIPFIGTVVGIAADMYLLGYVVLKLWDGRMKKKEIVTQPVAKDSEEAE